MQAIIRYTDMQLFDPRSSVATRAKEGVDGDKHTAVAGNFIMRTVLECFYEPPRYQHHRFLATYIPVVLTGLPKLLDEDGAYTGNKGVVSSQSSVNDDSEFTIGDYSNLNWKEQTWNFTCSTTETSTWAEGGRMFGKLMEQATGGKIKVNVYAADQLTGNGFS